MLRQPHPRLLRELTSPANAEPVKVLAVKVAEQNRSRAPWLVGLAVAALSWILFRQLSLEWRINPQYSYGWVVPILSLYLVWQRWQDRPASSEPTFLSASFALLPLLALTRLAQEANPDWRLLSWIAALSVTGILLQGFAIIGGKSWSKHFAFAIAFILVAVPWPTPIENLLVQSLMRAVAGIAVELLNWLGVAAQQDGNLIQLPAGTLSIDEACSGVRSFQATIMASLFLGELRRLNWPKRLALLASGAILALALNLIRAIFLALLAAKNGTATVQQWHDPAGYALLAATFFGLLAIARALAGKKLESPAIDSCNVFPNNRLNLASITILAWLAVCEIGTQTWYRWHERGEAQAARWQVDWPYGKANFERVPISEQIRLVLRYNEAEAARWDRVDGSRWFLFFFDWKPGRAAAALARNHRPETCLPATGFQLIGSRGVKIHHIAGIALPIERLEFKHADQRWHVYYCLWEDRLGQSAPDAGLLTRQARIRAVLEGRRHLGQRTLEVVITGIDSPERADEEFAQALANWIIVTKS